MTDVPIQVQRGSELRLVEQHDIRFLLGDQPVQVLLFLCRVDASHIPHEHCQRYFLDSQVFPWLLECPLVSISTQGPTGRHPRGRLVTLNPRELFLVRVIF